MLRPVVKRFTPTNGMDPPPDAPLRQTLLLKCGHFARRPPKTKGLWVKVHCELCEHHQKERDRRDAKRRRKMMKRERRRIHQLLKMRGHMAKKKMASKQVVAKKDLKKK